MVLQSTWESFANQLLESMLTVESTPKLVESGETSVRRILLETNRSHLRHD